MPDGGEGAWNTWVWQAVYDGIVRPSSSLKNEGRESQIGTTLSRMGRYKRFGGRFRGPGLK